MAPNDGFAKVHYGFILKAQNKIAESIPYLKVTVPALALCSFFDCAESIYTLYINWHALLSLIMEKMYIFLP